MSLGSRGRRKALRPDEVRAILGGVGRDRPELFDGNVVALPDAATPTSTITPLATTNELDGLVDDLLTGIHERGPVLQAHARRVARSIIRLDALDQLLDSAPALALQGIDWIATQERITRLRDLEDLAVHRGMILIDSLRDRRLTVTACNVVVRDRGRTSGRRSSSR